MAGEGAAQRAVQQQSEDTHALNDHDWPRDMFGNPMLRVSVAQAELVPTVQYGNSTLGPVQIVGFIPDGPDESIKAHLQRLTKIAESVIAEDRQTLQNEMQALAAAGKPTR